MVLKHSNPTQPRIDRQRKKYWARAPYNFVPLPENVVTVDEPPAQDAYHEDRLTGWIDCTLETCSPTYIRGMLTDEEFLDFGRKSADKLSAEEKKKMAPFFGIKENGQNGSRPNPVIPGSSLRGMIRSLIEIVSHGRIRWVADQPTFTFRAVAAAKDDPLREPYRDVIGSFGKNVRAGFLEKEKGIWYVRPAKTTRDMGWEVDEASYIKVKESHIDVTKIKGFTRFDSPDYQPRIHKVSFSAKVSESRRGKYISVSQIGAREAGYQYQGYLVCTGNMLETASPDKDSPRRNHHLVLVPNEEADRLEIPEQVIKDYRAGLTPFQKDLGSIWAGGDWGCLNEGAPVFYIAEQGKVAYFGHCPNFRIPAKYEKGVDKPAATPRHFVPKDLREGDTLDLADAIFGWVKDKSEKRTTERAGRVFFSNAKLLEGQQDVWLTENADDPLVPKTLAGPKPTTFQHYLVQDSDNGHDPDIKSSLAHYGSSPKETQIRGHKLYWHKGANPDIKATAKELQRESKSQLTHIHPIKPRVRFSFKIHFENLADYELGTLLWALALPDDSGKTFRHKLGMGKPLGLGAVKIEPELHLTNRMPARKNTKTRYQQLFDGNRWFEAEREADSQQYIDAFERFICDRIAPGKNRLTEIERIKLLLMMLHWQRETDPKWLDQTRYMEIEYGLNKLNEYKERPVLPNPGGVLDRYRSAPIQPEPAAEEAQSPQVGEMLGRVVKWKESYGFIEPEDESQQNIFVHKSQLRKGERLLREHDRVVFKIGKGRKGPEARDVRIYK